VSEDALPGELPAEIPISLDKTARRGCPVSGITYACVKTDDEALAVALQSSVNGVDLVAVELDQPLIKH